MLKARARYSSETMSATVPGALEVIAEPAMAPKKRITSLSSVRDSLEVGRENLHRLEIFS